MTILIDREQMCVRYKHQSQPALWNLMAIEFTHTSVICMEEGESGAYERFTDYELKMLYLNMCGQKYAGYSREILIEQVKELTKSLAPSELNGFELSLQANHITEKDNFFYRYQKGAQVPLKVEDRYVPPALVSVAGYTPAPVTTPAPQTAPASATQAASTTAAPRNPNSAPAHANAPKPGSKTGRVWELADQIFEAHPARPTDFKALRKLIVTACEAEGINGSTASVQYGYWKKTKE